MSYSALWFSQLQFYSSLSFMAVFLAMSLGLSWLLVYLRVRALGEQQLLWLPVYRFWVRIFALAFILCFASSMPVLIQLGSLWPNLVPKIHAVLGPILAVTLFGALLFKACFLGLMLYGQRQMSEWLHAGMVTGVALGLSFVSLCLLAWVAWMQGPQGGQWVDGMYQVLNWHHVLWTPTFAWYASQFISASFVLVALVLIAVLAMQSIRRPLGEGERRLFKVAVYLGSVAWLVLCVVSLVGGTALVDYQPMKAAAAMGYWGEGAVPRWLLMAWPSESQLMNLYELGWNSANTKWLAKTEGGFLGLEERVGMTPPVAVVFWSIRLALLAAILSLFVLLKGWRLGWSKHYDPSALSLFSRRCLVLAGFLEPLLLMAGLAYHYFGAFPYIVSHTITFAEVWAPRSVSQSVLGLVSYGVLYLLLAAGFISLVRYVARYGVISVARRRGRA